MDEEGDVDNRGSARHASLTSATMLECSFLACPSVRNPKILLLIDEATSALDS